MSRQSDGGINIFLLTYHLDFDTPAYSPICREFCSRNRRYFRGIAAGNGDLDRKVTLGQIVHASRRLVLEILGAP